MTTLSLRISDADAELFKKYAKFQGLTLSEFIKRSVLERIEDEYDLQELREAMKNPNPEYFSVSEVEKELGF